MSYNKADKFMIEEFMVCSRDALREYDRLIYNNLKNSRCAKYYKDEWKGLGIWGITEPIIRFLLCTKLCKDYFIFPERQYDDGSRCRADLTIYLDPKKYEREKPPDIAIEMKWGGIKKNAKPGILSQWSIKYLEEDLKKLRDHSKSPHNYVLQIAFVPKSVPISKNTLQRQIKDEISGYLTRFHNVRLLALESFDTHSTDIKNMDWVCWLFCWKIK